jgi:hypothetical protein
MNGHIERTVCSATVDVVPQAQPRAPLPIAEIQHSVEIEISGQNFYGRALRSSSMELGMHPWSFSNSNAAAEARLS